MLWAVEVLASAGIKRQARQYHHQASALCLSDVPEDAVWRSFRYGPSPLYEFSRLVPIAFAPLLCLRSSARVARPHLTRRLTTEEARAEKEEATRQPATDREAKRRVPQDDAYATRLVQRAAGLMASSYKGDARACVAPASGKLRTAYSAASSAAGWRASALPRAFSSPERVREAVLEAANCGAEVVLVGDAPAAGALLRAGLRRLTPRTPSSSPPPGGRTPAPSGSTRRGTPAPAPARKSGMVDRSVAWHIWEMSTVAYSGSSKSSIPLSMMSPKEAPVLPCEKRMRLGSKYMYSKVGRIMQMSIPCSGA
eukprot:tig00020572_g11536.t1